MAIWDKLIRRKVAQVGTPIWGMSGFPMPLAGASAASFVQAYGEVGWVFACVSRISSAVADANWTLYQVGRNERTEIMSHPLIDLLDFVNPFSTGNELLETTQMYIDLTGEAFWVLLRNGSGRPVEIWPVLPSRMTIVPSATEFISGYIYTVGGQRIPLEPADVIHVKLPNPSNPYRGIGPVSSIMQDIDSERFAAGWNRAFFQNSAEPGGVIQVDGVMPEEQYERLRLQWHEQHQGINRAHRVAILESGATWHDRRVTQRDMQFKDLRHVNRDIILGAFGMPMHILGISESVNRANAEAAEYTFSRWVVKPRLTRLRNKLNEQLAPLFGDNLELDFSNPVPANTELNMAMADAGFKGGYLTRNEARALLGESPVADGDIFLEPMTGQLSEASLMTLSHQPQLAIKELTPDGAGLVASDETTQAVIDVPEFEASTWKAFVDRISPQEREMEAALRELFEQQAKDVLKIFDREERGFQQKQIDAETLFDDAVWVERTASVGTPLLRNALLQSARSFSLQYDFGFDAADPRVEAWLGSRIDRFSHSITTTTKEAIRKQLEQAHIAGEGIPAIRNRIQSVFTTATRSRATTIARTEMVSASNQGLLEAAAQSGIVQGKRWLAALDERVRDTHADAHGRYQSQPISLFEEFEVGGDRMLAPGQGSLAEENINCRCTMVEVLDVDRMDEERSVNPPDNTPDKSWVTPIPKVNCPNCGKAIARKILGSFEIDCKRCRAIVRFSIDNPTGTVVG